MKKRITHFGAALLAAVMLFTLLPLAALAAEEPTSIPEPDSIVAAEDSVVIEPEEITEPEDTTAPEDQPAEDATVAPEEDAAEPDVQPEETPEAPDALPADPAEAEAAPAEDDASIAALGNESPATATPIRPNVQTTKTSMASTSDYDWYKFTLTSPGKVSLTFTNDFVDRSYGWVVDLHMGTPDTTKNTTLIQRHSYYANTSPHHSMEYGLPAGDYYIFVETGYSPIVGVEYQLTVNYQAADDWETEWNESATAANPLTIGTFRNGSCISSSDNDWYTFTLPSDGAFSLTFANDYANRSIGWEVIVYFAIDGGFNTTPIATYYPVAEVGTRDYTQIGLPAGKYYIHVKTNYSPISGLNYKLRVNHDPRTDWETEWNNDPQNADVIQLGSTIHANLLKEAKSNDVDWFRFTMPAAGVVSPTFKNDLLDRSYGWDVDIFRASGGYDGNSLKEYGFKANTTTHNGEGVNLAAGEYYVRVKTEYTPIRGLAYSLQLNHNVTVAAEKVTLNMPAKTLKKGSSVTLKATVSPSNASNKKVTWSTSNKKVATVSPSGKVKALKNGTAKITVKTANGKKATCTIKVGGTAVKSVKLSKSRATLNVGGSTTLKVTFSPKKPSNKKVSWSTSDATVATVSSKGKVTAVGAGTCKITVKSNDGAKAKSCTITVR